MYDDIYMRSMQHAVSVSVGRRVTRDQVENKTPSFTQSWGALPGARCLGARMLMMKATKISSICNDDNTKISVFISRCVYISVCLSPPF